MFGGVGRWGEGGWQLRGGVGIGVIVRRRRGYFLANLSELEYGALASSRTSEYTSISTIKFSRYNCLIVPRKVKTYSPFDSPMLMLK